MVTQHEVDVLAREVRELVQRVSRLEGDHVELRGAFARLGARVVGLAPRTPDAHRDNDAPMSPVAEDRS